MINRYVVTGATGFVGSHLVEFLLAEEPNCEIVCSKRYHLSRVDKAESFFDKVTWVDVNLMESGPVARLIEQYQPKIIFHCAAESFVSPSWNHPKQYMRVNYDATVNLLEAVRNHSPETILHIPGSGEEYGDVSESDLPITPKTVLKPVNPYAVTKIAQDLISSVYYESYGIKVVRTRAFNHEGPRRENVFGISWYAFQLACIELGLQEPVLTTGATSDKRNFTHVKDMVRAYWLACTKCEYGKLYLVGNDSDAAVHTFSEAIDRLLTFSTVQSVDLAVDPRFIRPTSVPFLIADVEDFKSATGWKPELSFDQILLDTLDYWRGVLKRNPSYAKVRAL